MKRRTMLWGLFLVLSFKGLYAQQRYDLSVKEAVDLAFKHVVDIRNAQVDVQTQAAQNREIAGQAFPQISGAVGAQRYMSLPKFLFPDFTQTTIYGVLVKEGLLPSSTKVPLPVYQSVSFQQPWNFNAGATITQLLFQPDVFVGLQARETALHFSESNLEQIKEKIKDSAYKRYYAILIAQKQLHFLNESIGRLEKLYHDDSLMYVNGFAERLDLDKVQVQLNNLRTAQSMVESGVTLAYAAMKFSLGISQKDTVVLKDELSDSAIKRDILDESFDYANRAEIRTLSYSKHLQELNIKRYQLEYLPTVALAGNYTVNAMGPHFFTDPSTVWFHSSYVGVNLNVPIFDGFQRKSKVQEARLGLKKVENTIDLVKQGIDLEQVVSKESLNNALYNLNLQERNLELAQRVYNMTKLKFEQGLGSSFEVLQSDTDYQTAQSNYFNALYNAVVAKINYMYSLGKL